MKVRTGYKTTKRRRRKKEKSSADSSLRRAFLYNYAIVFRRHKPALKVISYGRIRPESQAWKRSRGVKKAWMMTDVTWRPARKPTDADSTLVCSFCGCSTLLRTAKNRKKVWKPASVWVLPEVWEPASVLKSDVDCRTARTRWDEAAVWASAPGAERTARTEVRAFSAEESPEGRMKDGRI